MSDTKQIEDPFRHIDVQIKRDGKAITLPSDPTEMPYRTAADLLIEKANEEEMTIQVHELVEAFPWDGAQAFMKALYQMFGWVKAVPKGFFRIPPDYRAIKTGPGYNDTTQIIWGQFEIPGVESALYTGYGKKNGRTYFELSGEVKKKHFNTVKQLADLTRKIVAEQSIYKGKAIRLLTNGEDLNMEDEPTFLDPSVIREDELIFNDDVARQIATNIFSPIQHTQRCIEHGIPLKRGILLEGPYGTGKTMTAAVVSKKCVENGWTFITIEDVSAIGEALFFAKMYAPAVLFCEDIDRVVKGQRSISMDAILNTIDGVQGKNDQIITILTTNHVEEINQAMLRPGRLDAVISVRPPDAKAAERLMRVYGRGLISPKEPLTRAGQIISGQIPATIREVVERSKLSAISRQNGRGKIELKDDDLVIAAEGMMQHLELLNRDTGPDHSPEEQLGILMRDVVGAGGREMLRRLNDIRAKACSILEQCSSIKTDTLDLKVESEHNHEHLVTIEKSVKQLIELVNENL